MSATSCVPGVLTCILSFNLCCSLTEKRHVSQFAGRGGWVTCVYPLGSRVTRPGREPGAPIRDCIPTRPQVPSTPSTALLIHNPDITASLSPSTSKCPLSRFLSPPLSFPIIKSFHLWTKIKRFNSFSYETLSSLLNRDFIVKETKNLTFKKLY